MLKCGPIGHKFKKPVNVTLPTPFIERDEERDVRVRVRKASISSFSSQHVESAEKFQIK